MPLCAALAGAALLTALLPAAGGADTAPSLRARADAARAERAAAARAEHRALLDLYAAEAALGRSRRQTAALVARADLLARAEASARRRAEAVRQSLVASRARIAAILEALYIEGEADPIAAILGASSLDEVLAALESLERAALQNRRLAAEARERGLQLAKLRGQLALRRTALDAATTAASDATLRLGRAAEAERATLASIRRRGQVAERRIAALVEQARTAERTSARIENAAAPVAAEASAATAQPSPASAPPAAAAGTRTLVVDAVAYHLPGRTASGLPVGPGIVAVDPTVIPLGTRLFIPGYGPGIAADTGTAIKGNIIDLWMPSTAAARRWGRRTVTITIYG